MNIEEHLILLNGEDRTEAIKSCTYEKGTGKWKVVFKNNAKEYNYSFPKVKWLKNPFPYDPSDTVVYKDKQPLWGVNKILDFQEYVSLGYNNGYNKVYSGQEINLEQSCLKDAKSKNVFGYLKQLAGLRKIDDEEEQSFLGKQYDRITHVSPASVLANYLNPLSLEKTQENQQIPIFPFGFNLSQKAATEKALSEKLSVIEGPPGTGKTQTILNIIANAVIQGKTVAVVSNNNSATANVLEKLQKQGLDFIAAYLGNFQNKSKFFTEQTGLYPDLSSWAIEPTDIALYQQKIHEQGPKLSEMLEMKNQLALLKQELATLTVEKEYFNTYLSENLSNAVSFKSFFTHNSSTIMSLWLEYEQVIKERGGLSLLHKLENLFRYGITSFSFYANSSDQIITLLQKLYYEKKETELKEQHDQITKRLENYHFEENMKEYSYTSLILFKALLAQRYSYTKERKTFTSDALWKEFNAFIKEYPVVLSTTYSLRTCTSSNYLFDYVIMDEASQVDIVTGALALSCARNAVIVGDIKQLPNVVNNELADKAHNIFAQFALPKAYDFAEYSMLSSITNLFMDVPKTMLREHYRCHPQIIGFCNSKFYNGELIILTEENGWDMPLTVYKTAPGNHARGKYNQRQIDVILEEVLPKYLGRDNNKVGIISPFRVQAEKITRSLGGLTIEVDTVHKYQGREKDIVILTTVVNDINDFVDNPNLINVAVSRAVDRLIVVISDYDRNKSSNLDDLVRYIEYNNFEVVHSNIYSVFDLLYHRYAEELRALKQKRKRVSEHESENLMNAVMEKVLRKQEYLNLDWVMHQPLRMLIRNPEKLTDDECQFAMNVFTHTDFVIFNKLDKRPVLVVEVDGYAFHENNPKQLARDQMKDTILTKYGIPILRLKTNGSREEERLRAKLREVVG
ncbi:AAA domain-containing protein [Desulfitobacterium sp. THU1]|uniref:AAA domain-containing protein n=1 Tax=Desulfitobacterium sp. THU1 TaxID=3138072 RepID=UPI00311F321C